MHHSVLDMWSNYLTSVGQRPGCTELRFQAWHFCDNQRDADELAQLVLNGTKRATAPCLWQIEDGHLPQCGDLDVITFWSGRACCVIRTTEVEIKSFADVSPAFAACEGEGDGSLAYWRQAHWAYYARVLSRLGRVPSYDMPILCQRFERVYSHDDGTSLADQP